MQVLAAHPAFAVGGWVELRQSVAPALFAGGNDDGLPVRQFFVHAFA